MATVTEYDTDRYGRTVGVVLVEGANVVNQLLILTPCQRPKMTPQKSKKTVFIFTSNFKSGYRDSSSIFL
jgi:hypothetical protein